MKIAILVDSLVLPHWKHKLIKDLQSNESVKLTIIQTRYSLLNRVLNNVKRLSNILFYVYEKLDYLIFSKTNKFKEIKFEKDALRRFSLKRSKYKVIDLNVRKNSFLYSKNDHIYKEKLFDLVVDLSETLKKDFYKDLNKYSKKGICFFEYGESSYPPFLNEIYSNKPTANTYLSLSDGQSKTILYKSCSSIYNFSLYLNNNKNYWKVSDFINRIIDKIEKKNLLSPHSGLNKESFKYHIKFPSNLMMFKFIAIILNNLIGQKITNKKLQGQWFLAYKKALKETDFVSENQLNFNIITPPRDRFFADPFIINEQNKSYVFFEDYYYSKQKGVISYFEINEKEEISEPKVILERNCHLSYPFIFKYEDKYYMVPETLGNRTIELYEAENFPEKWKLKKVLFDKINAVDTSLVIYNQKFWLFTNLSNAGGGISDELYIFYSDSLMGEWKPHSKNPVVSDVKTARSAGKLFFYKGQLIRPSQETSFRYGYGLNFNAIDILNETDYKETLIKTVYPEFINDNLAIHTFNSDDKYKIIDGMKLVKK